MNRAQADDWMAAALELAARGRGTTRPNPMVGSIVLRDGQPIGEGFHERAGEAHAEVHALRSAGSAAHGCELIVTLEPCCHVGRTPACTDAIIDAGIKRVWVGCVDPNPRVAGQGIAALRRAGIEVDVGFRDAECQALNRGYNHWMRTGRPRVTLKLATSLDGKIATSTGASQWITGPDARRAVHSLRNDVDAIMVGSGTALADNPSLTVRDVPLLGAQPTRVLVDSRLQVSPDAKLFARNGADVVVATSDEASPVHLAAREEQGARMLRLSTTNGHVDLHRLMTHLAELEHAPVRSVLVEGGSGLATALLRANLVDELRLFMAPIWIGADGLGALGELGVSHPDSAPRFEIVTTARHGEDVEVILQRTEEATCSPV